jgi:aryl-alcohol dehydrogenase-like predicted oxidoreductase
LTDLQAYGASGLTVSALGLGCAAVGDPAMGEEDAGRLLNGALDLGIALFDTARSGSWVAGCRTRRISPP